MTTTTIEKIAAMTETEIGAMRRNELIDLLVQIEVDRRGEHRRESATRRNSSLTRGLALLALNTELQLSGRPSAVVAAELQRSLTANDRRMMRLYASL